MLIVTNLFLFVITGFKYAETNPFLKENLVGTLELNKTVSESNPATGVSFFYTLQYRCASTVDDCIGTVITDPLPPEVEYVGLTGSPHTINEVYDAGTHTVTFTFQNILTAGSTGEVQIEVRYPNGVTPNGTVANNTATIDATNAASVSASVSNTAFAEAVLDLDKYYANGGGVGGYMSYGFRVCNTNYTGNSTDGKLNIENIYVIDTLPPGAVYLESNLSGGSIISYDPVTNIIQFSVTDLEVNECRWPRITVQYSDPPYDINSSVTNVGHVYGTPIGESEIEAIDTLTHGFVNPIAQISSWKHNTHEYLTQGERATYELDFELEGTEGFDDFCIVDTIPLGVEIQQIYHGGYYTAGISIPEDIVTISYTTNLNGPQVIVGSPFSRWLGYPNYISVENDLGLVEGGPEYITSISWCFGDVPAGFGAYDDILLAYQVRMDAPVGLTINCMEFTTSTDTSIVTTDIEEDCANLTILENTNDAIAYAWKRAMNIPLSGRYNPGDTIDFNLLAQNPSSSTIPIVNPELLDLLPPELTYVPGSWQIPPWSQTLSTSPIFTETPNYNGSGQTLLAWSWTGDSTSQIEIGRETNIEFKAVISEDALAGKDVFYNNYAFVGDGISDCWGYEDADIYDLNNNANTSELLCFDSARISVNGLVSLESEKLVKGQLDSTFTKFPDVAHSVPGGISDYILEVRNPGNIPMDSIVIIDIFPSVGDIGVVDTAARDSRWQPNLVSTINAPSGVTVYYSIEGNPCRNDEGFVATGPVGCATPNWSTTPPTDLTTVHSVKFEFGSTLLQPQDTIQLSWSMRVPVNIFSTIGAQPDSIAWNSFGFIGRRTDNGQYILPSEPVKVGIDVDNVVPNVYGDFVWEDTNQNGIQDGGEPGIDGVRVELFKDNGDGITDPTVDTFINFTLTANGGYYLFPNLDDGDYYTVFYKPAAMDITINDAGGNDAVDSDGVTGTYNGFDVAISPIVTLDNFAYDLSWDLGLYPSNTGAVGDYVWNDANGNGIQDESNSEGINGVTLYLYDNASPSSPIDSAVTSNDPNGNPGYYLFSVVTPNSYFLELELPAGVSYSTQGPNGSSDPSDSDFNIGTNRTEVFSVTAGNYDNSWDAGLILSGTEICDNGVDDDGDNLTDCEDPECPIIVNSTNLNTCDNSNGTGQGTFFLPDARTVIVGSLTGMTVSFYSTLSDAENKVNELSNSFNSSNSTIYASVEKDGTVCFTTTTVALSVGAACEEICDDGIDNDGNGLIDCFDCESCASSVSCSDNDGDGIGDFCDLDDDNDGIPDSIECPNNIYGIELIENGDFEDGYANWTSDFNRGRNNYFDTRGNCPIQGWVAISPCATLNGVCNEYYNYLGGTYDGSVVITDSYGTGANILPTINCNQTASSCLATILPDHTTGSGFSLYVDPNNISGQAYWKQMVTVESGKNYEFSAWMMVIEEDPNLQFRINGINLTNGFNLDRQTGGSNGTDVWQQFFANWYSGSTSGTIEIELVNLTAGCGGNDIRVDDVSLREMIADCDCDGDGVINSFDLDSDNDGLYDVAEAGHSASDTNLDGMIDNANLNSGNNGLFDALETTPGSGTLNYIVADSETSPDGIFDICELDSDGDGCFDAEEENVSDSDADGIVGTGTPTVNTDGLVNGNIYAAPPNDFWQNPLIGSCLLEICDDGLDNDGDGNTDCTDSDCIPIANPTILTTCDNSNMTGSGVFILHDANPTVSTESGMIISYHPTLLDAQNGINNLISPHTSSDGTVYARVERISTGCFNTALIALDVGVKCVESCENGVDDDGDGLIDTVDPDCPCSGSN